MFCRNLKFQKIWLIQINPLSANPTKWSNTLKQFVGNLPTNCLRVFDQFVGLPLKGLKFRNIFLRMQILGTEFMHFFCSRFSQRLKFLYCLLTSQHAMFIAHKHHFRREYYGLVLKFTKSHHQNRYIKVGNKPPIGRSYFFVTRHGKVTWSCLVQNYPFPFYI